MLKDTCEYKSQFIIIVQYNNFLACLMDEIGLANTSSAYVNLENHFDCKQKCIKEKDCLMWTYIGRRCYLKNDNTFAVTNALVTAGKRGCNSLGTIVLSFLF